MADQNNQGFGTRADTDHQSDIDQGGSNYQDDQQRAGDTGMQDTDNQQPDEM
jgi:hypothetical protein